MKAVDGIRDDVVLATELYVFRWEADREGMYEAVRRHTKMSMERLRTDYAELHYIHRVDREEPVEDVARPWAGSSTRA